MSAESLDISFVVRTDAGLCGIWQPERFSGVVSLGDFEREVSDEAALSRHVAAGAFVPLNVGGDGSFQVAVRDTGVTDREAPYVLVSSAPYLLESRGVVELGGLENVGGYVGGAQRVPLSPGRYQVLVHLIDWESEPGSTADGGGPAAHALPDFVVHVMPEPEGEASYRTSIETFEKPA